MFCSVHLDNIWAPDAHNVSLYQDFIYERRSEADSPQKTRFPKKGEIAEIRLRLFLNFQ